MGQLGIGDTITRNSPQLILADSPHSQPFTQICCGDQHSMAIRDGVVYSWGCNSRGQLAKELEVKFVSIPEPVDLTSVDFIGAGLDFSFAIWRGIVFLWGDNRGSQLGIERETFCCVPTELQLDCAIVSAAAAQYCTFLVSESGSVFEVGDLMLWLETVGKAETPTRRIVEHKFHSPAWRVVCGCNHVVALLKC
jgi:alpha-tubulin suppressor-like RCC1 family protein